MTFWTKPTKISLEGKISYEEASKTLLSMSNNKSPGSDGFTAEFFKMFWKNIGHFVIRSLNYGYDTGELSSTQKQGIIPCIPKDGKPKQFLKNWRPISLLNVVYKIASGCIAKRLKSCIHKLISSDQTGFVPGRYIGENTRLVYDLMQYTEENNIPGILLMIDFEKAFDSVSWNFIDKTLDLFNFGGSFRKWISVFRKNSISAVSQAGFLSPFFSLSRGCRQGDPISSYIFLLCAEILAIRIKGNEDIKGIHIGQKEHVISQYADDTLLMLDGSEKALQKAVDEINFFYRISGLKMNLSKTQIVWIGSKRFSNEILVPEFNFQWTTRFNLLGVCFDVDLSRIAFLNYDKKLVKIKSLIAQWSKRRLTPIGRLTIIKTLLVSQLNHLFISLPNPDARMLRELNDILYTFLWGSKVDKIKRNVITQPFDVGGLNMPNILNYIHGLKATWIKRLISTGDTSWKNIVGQYIDINKLLSTGQDFIDIVVKNVTNQFWKDVFISWIRLREKTKICSWSEYITQPLWYNKRLQIGNKPTFDRDWYDNGIKYINYLIDDNGDIITLQTLQNRYNFTPNIMMYLGIKHALQVDIRRFNFTRDEAVNQRPFIPFQLKVLLTCRKGSKPMYNIINQMSCEPTGKVKWNAFINFDDNQWKIIFSMPFKNTTDSKLQWIQFRVNHSIIVTNKLLVKLGKKDSSNCTFCDSEEETIYDLFWECRNVKDLLHRIENIFVDNNVPIHFSDRTFLFGVLDGKKASKPYNNIIMSTKCYIYRCRCLNTRLSLMGLIHDLKTLYIVNKYVYARSNKRDDFHTIWNDYAFLVDL